MEARSGLIEAAGRSAKSIVIRHSEHEVAAEAAERLRSMLPGATISPDRLSGHGDLTVVISMAIDDRFPQTILWDPARSRDLDQVAHQFVVGAGVQLSGKLCKVGSDGVGMQGIKHLMDELGVEPDRTKRLGIRTKEKAERAKLPPGDRR